MGGFLKTSSPEARRFFIVDPVPSLFLIIFFQTRSRFRRLAPRKRAAIINEDALVDLEIRGRRPRITLRAHPRGAPPGASCTNVEPEESFITFFFLHVGTRSPALDLRLRLGWDRLLQRGGRGLVQPRMIRSAAT